MNKSILFLMGNKGLACLKAVFVKFPLSIEMVVYAHDKNVSNDYVDEIKLFCTLNSIRSCDRKEWESSNYNGASKFGVAVSWRWMIQSSELNLIVLHDSLLPKYRGFNPLVTALINGDTTIGVTALLANKEFDRGDIIGQAAMQIIYPCTIETAIDQITTKYAELIVSVFNKLNKDKLDTIPQNESDATYSLWRDNEDYFLDWNLDASILERTVNALGFPYNGAQTNMGDEIIIIKKAIALSNIRIENRTPGKIIFSNKNEPEVVCGNGLLRIIEAENLNRTKVIFSKFRQRFK